jgi:phosphoglycerate kinase
MSYYEALKEYKLSNLTKLESPTLMRLDINLPVDRDGNVAGDNLRLRVNANLITLCSEYSGLVLMSHQGRRGDRDFVSLRQHKRFLDKALPADISVEFIPFEETFSPDTRRRIENLKKKEVLLLDNVRFFDDETNFNPSNCSFIKLFRGLIKSCVNEAMPTWHRDHSSLMCLPYIAPTYIGMRSYYELGILEELLHSKESKALIMGGKKLQKASYIKTMAEYMDIYVGGLVGQAISIAKGYDLGPKNNEFVRSQFSPSEFEGIKEILKHHEILTPIDYVVLEDGEKKNLQMDEMSSSKGMIMDIGKETTYKYAELLQGYEIRIRAGPLGVYEEGYDHGILLTKLMSGGGLIFLGGDTTQEIIDYHLDGIITDVGGRILLSGGAFLHGMAKQPYPSLDLILQLKRS